MVVSVVLGCALLLLVAAVVIYRRRLKSSSTANTSSSATATATAPASSTPPRPNRSLNLFGWRAKRQHLIDKEQAELGNPDTVAHVASYVQFTDVAPSAPDADFVSAAYVASAPNNESASDTNTDIIKVDTSQ